MIQNRTPKGAALNALIALILCSGLIIKCIVKIKSGSGYKEDDRTWDELKES